MDSPNFYQVNNQMGGLVNYTFGKKDASRNLIEIQMVAFSLIYLLIVTESHKILLYEKDNIHFFNTADTFCFSSTTKL